MKLKLTIMAVIGMLISSCHRDEVRGLAVNSITPLENLPATSRTTKSPIPVNQLAYVKVRYWGYDDHEHVGEMIVNRELAQDVLEIFMELDKQKFPIEQMKLISEFNNNDDLSMDANNSSAFNYREVTGQPGIFSQHSYGRAIDINPRVNPYVKKSLVLPKNSEGYINRDVPAKGKINRQSLPYRLFTERGWDWGGNWFDLQDYQHFEKRANGEKRNPHGY